MTILDRFIKYIKIDTTSNSNNDNTPSSKGQFVFANILVDELNKLQLDEIFMDEEHCYIYARLKGVADLPKIGFVSHLDTSSSASGKNISPKIIYNYDGKNVKLNNNTELDVSVYSDLKNHVGKTLITTDGTTLLGSDDKAGIAEIMNMLEYYSTNDVEHGDIFICFTPDEEIGNGTKYLNYNIFKPDYAYTVDGGELGDMSYECFHAASARVTVHGKSVHPGTAKNVMKNAIKLAYEFISMLPDKECPECTEGYEGFYHVTDIKGTVEEATVDFIIRDHDRAIFEKRKEVIAQAAEKLNKVYGETIFEVEIKDSYHNMKEMIEKEMHVVDNLKEAMLKAGVTPKVSPIRGGTDGARLSYEGLLCPNLCTGSEGHHGRNEFACMEDMEKIVEILKQIIYVYAQ